MPWSLVLIGEIHLHGCQPFRGEFLYGERLWQSFQIFHGLHRAFHESKLSAFLDGRAIIPVCRILSIGVGSRGV